MPATINSETSDPALGAMFVAGGRIETYVEGAGYSKLDELPAPGMVLHWAAQSPEGTLTGSIWRERRLAERFMANVLADTFTEIVGADHENDRTSPDFSYSTLALVNYLAGADASRVVGRKVGGASGAVLIRPRVSRGEIEYRAIARSLGFENAAPPGMISHVAATDGEDVRWTDLWLDRAAPTAFYEEGGIASESLELIALHTVFANADELAQLPRYPRS